MPSVPESVLSPSWHFTYCTVNSTELAGQDEGPEQHLTHLIMVIITPCWDGSKGKPLSSALKANSQIDVHAQGREAVCTACRPPADSAELCPMLTGSSWRCCYSSRQTSWIVNRQRDFLQLEGWTSAGMFACDRNPSEGEKQNAAPLSAKPRRTCQPIPIFLIPCCSPYKKLLIPVISHCWGGGLPARGNRSCLVYLRSMMAEALPKSTSTGQFCLIL